MNLTAIRTKRFEPPQDDLYIVLDEVLPPLAENDVIVVASKVVAIHEGRCVMDTSPSNKQKLIKEESDYVIPTPTPGGWDMTVKNDAITFAAGIDESNVGNCLLLLPENPTLSAKNIRKYLKEKHCLTNLGVIISDSSALPYRQGSIAVSIGHAGFKPTKNEVGAVDLFGRPFAYTHVNIVDALAIAAGFVMGETNESTPLCLVRDIPHITFTDEDYSDDLLIRPKDDVFYPLLKGTYRKDDK